LVAARLALSAALAVVQASRHAPHGGVPLPFKARMLVSRAARAIEIETRALTRIPSDSKIDSKTKRSAI
jgi:hypothetical protein